MVSRTLALFVATTVALATAPLGPAGAQGVPGRPASSSRESDPTTLRQSLPFSMAQQSQTCTDHCVELPEPLRDEPLNGEDLIKSVIIHHVAIPAEIQATLGAFPNLTIALAEFMFRNRPLRVRRGASPSDQAISTEGTARALVLLVASKRRDGTTIKTDGEPLQAQHPKSSISTIAGQFVYTLADLKLFNKKEEMHWIPNPDMVGLYSLIICNDTKCRDPELADLTATVKKISPLILEVPADTSAPGSSTPTQKPSPKSATESPDQSQKPATPVPAPEPPRQVFLFGKEGAPDTRKGFRARIVDSCDNPAQKSGNIAAFTQGTATLAFPQSGRCLVIDRPGNSRPACVVLDFHAVSLPAVTLFVDDLDRRPCPDPDIAVQLSFRVRELIEGDDPQWRPKDLQAIRSIDPTFTNMLTIAGRKVGPKGEVNIQRSIALGSDAEGTVTSIEIALQSDYYRSMGHRFLAPNRLEIDLDQTYLDVRRLTFEPVDSNARVVDRCIPVLTIPRSLVLPANASSDVVTTMTVSIDQVTGNAKYELPPQHQTLRVRRFERSPAPTISFRDGTCRLADGTVPLLAFTGQAWRPEVAQAGTILVVLATRTNHDLARLGIDANDELEFWRRGFLAVRSLEQAAQGDPRARIERSALSFRTSNTEFGGDLNVHLTQPGTVLFATEGDARTLVRRIEERLMSQSTNQEPFDFARGIPTALIDILGDRAEARRFPATRVVVLGPRISGSRDGADACTAIRSSEFDQQQSRFTNAKIFVVELYNSDQPKSGPAYEAQRPGLNHLVFCTSPFPRRIDGALIGTQLTGTDILNRTYGALAERMRTFFEAN